jgi:hypothetical protein
MGLLDGPLARKLCAAYERTGYCKAATLHVVTKGVRDPGNLTGGTNPTVVEVPCKGLVVSWNRERLGGTLVQASDRVVRLLATTLRGEVPKVGDRVTIEGVTAPVLSVARGPAGASYLCMLRS